MQPLASNPLGLAALLDHPLVFVILVVITVASIGLASRSMAVAGWGGYVAFAELGLASGNGFFEQIVIASLALIAVGIGFKLWRLEAAGAGG